MIVIRPWLNKNRPVIWENVLDNTTVQLYGHEEGYFKRGTADGPSLYHVDDVCRHQGAQLNPFLVALSAHHKLEAYFDSQEKLGMKIADSPLYAQLMLM